KRPPPRWGEGPSSRAVRAAGGPSALLLAAFLGLLRHLRRGRVHELQEGHRRRVALADARTDDAGVAARAVGEPLRERTEELLEDLLVPHRTRRQSTRVDGALLAEGDHLLGRLARLLRLRDRRPNPLVAEERGHEVLDERFAMGRGPRKLAAGNSVSHVLSPSPSWKARCNASGVGRGRSSRLRRPVLELHAEAEPHLRTDLLDLLEALSAEILRLEHFRLGLLHEIADGADVGVLQAVGRADRELQLVHRAKEVLVELLLHLRTLRLHLFLGLVEV